MDLSVFYGKIRQQEKKLEDEFPIIASHETGNGGKAGVLAEVARNVAARFVVMGLARIATGEEVKMYRDAEAAAKRIADEFLEAAKAQTVVVTSAAIQRLQNKLRLGEEVLQEVKE